MGYLSFGVDLHAQLGKELAQLCRAVKLALHNVKTTRLAIEAHCKHLLVNNEWESDDYEEGEVPKLVFWTNERLPDGRTVFARCHYEEDVHLVGKVVWVEGAKLEIKGLEKLTHTDHLYVYDMCYPYGEQGHLTVKEVMEMPAMKKNTYTFYEHEEGEFEDENVEDVVVLKKKPSTYNEKRFLYKYVKMGVAAIAFLKAAVKDMEDHFYLVPTGDCICCT